MERQNAVEAGELVSSLCSRPLDQGPRGDCCMRVLLFKESVVTFGGRQDGDLIEILVQKRKDTKAAKRFFRKALRSQTAVPIEITTDKLRSYASAKREVMPSVPHCQDHYANARKFHTSRRGNKKGRCAGFDRTDTRSAF